jgi:hypothetical protein
LAQPGISIIAWGSDGGAVEGIVHGADRRRHPRQLPDRGRRSIRSGRARTLRLSGFSSRTHCRFVRGVRTLAGRREGLLPAQSSVSQPRMPRDTARAMGEADQIDTEEFRRDYEALSRRDWDQARRLHHPQIEWQDMPKLRLLESITAGRRFGSGSTKPPLTSQSGVSSQRSSFQPVTSSLSRPMWITTGHERLELDFELFQVWTFRDGLAIRQQMFRQREQALEAAGLLE